MRLSVDIQWWDYSPEAIERFGETPCQGKVHIGKGRPDAVGWLAIEGVQNISLCAECRDKVSAGVVIL